MQECSTSCLEEGRFELLTKVLMENIGFYIRLSLYTMTPGEEGRFRHRLAEMFTMMGIQYSFCDQGARMRVDKSIRPDEGKT